MYGKAGDDFLYDEVGDDLLNGGGDDDTCTDPMGANKFVQCEVKE
jgi:Ca2+-binding RTX toxin-like protein